MIRHLSACVICATTTLASAETALYRVTFDATWSADTHPFDFPPAPHFSGLVGGTHNEDVAFWTLGAIASDGIESMAETGSKTLLIQEVQTAIDEGTARTVISGPGIFPSPASATMTFMVHGTHSRITIVSMIAPSPDWFVGIDGFDVRSGDRWVEEATFDLDVFDAGSDNGLMFTAPNADTQPPDPITVKDDYAFADAPQVGTFTLTLLSTGGTPDLTGDGVVAADDLALLLGAWGSCEEDCFADLTGDDQILADDLALLLGAWG